MSNLSEATVQAIKAAMSPARMGTYGAAVGFNSDAALRLYAWSAEVSGAFMAPLHVCEVVIRNSCSDAISQRYGSNWPWSAAFEQSLPTTGRYKPGIDLFGARANKTTVGQVIPEHKFAFWQRLFTSRHDDRLWTPYVHRVFPNLDSGKTTSQLRESIYNSLDQVGYLRNRIAHHEPIFARDLVQDYVAIEDLVRLRCAVTAHLLHEHQQTLTLIGMRP